MAHLDSTVIDSEYGFLEMFTEWLGRRAVIQFGRHGDDKYQCTMTYQSRVHETTGRSPYEALKIAAGQHSSDDLYGAKK